jgi:DNA-binding ferritin-like protein (Dps family)
LQENCKSIKGELRDFVSRIAGELGLLPQVPHISVSLFNVSIFTSGPFGWQEGENISPAMKMAATRRAADRQVDDLLGKVDDLTTAIEAVNERVEANEVSTIQLGCRSVNIDL